MRDENAGDAKKLFKKFNGEMPGNEFEVEFLDLITSDIIEFIIKHRKNIELLNCKFGIAFIPIIQNHLVQIIYRFINVAERSKFCIYFKYFKS